MKFAIYTESEEEHELYSPNELEWAVDRLNNEEGSFLCVIPEAPINAINYMQAAYIRKTKGFFKKTVIASYYEVEVQEEKPSGDLIQYFLSTENVETVMQIFNAFFESQTIPDLKEWRSELFYKAER